VLGLSEQRELGDRARTAVDQQCCFRFEAVAYLSPKVLIRFTIINQNDRCNDLGKLCYDGQACSHTQVERPTSWIHAECSEKRRAHTRCLMVGEMTGTRHGNPSCYQGHTGDLPQCCTLSNCATSCYYCQRFCCATSLHLGAEESGLTGYFCASLLRFRAHLLTATTSKYEHRRRCPCFAIHLCLCLSPRLSCF
jgi:hypothetical protein